MPDHTSWFSYLLTLPGLRSLEHALDSSGMNRSMSHTSESILNHPHTPITLEYSLLAVLAIVVILMFAVVTKGRVSQT